MTKRNVTDFIVIHCAATPPGMDIGAAEIDGWHRERGWSGIGYHYVIRLNGQIEAGRELDAVGAHAYGYNSRSIGVCYVGGLGPDRKTAADTRTLEQRHALADLVHELKELYPAARVVGHCDLPGVHKACPSFDVASWLAEEGL